MKMEITDLHFRDNAVVHISIGYDWINSNNYAIITMLESNDVTNSFRINGLLQYAIYDNFDCMVVDQCKLIKNEEGIYLSLDPYNELGPIEEKDNFCFWGKSIEMVSTKC